VRGGVRVRGGGREGRLGGGVVRGGGPVAAAVAAAVPGCWGGGCCVFRAAAEGGWGWSTWERGIVVWGSRRGCGRGRRWS